MKCYRKGGCGPYEQLSCSECPASKPSYIGKGGTAPARVMPREEAFRVVAKHIYEAHRMYSDDPADRQLLILADSIEEAKEKAQKAFGISTVFVKLAKPTDDPQVYDI